MPVTKTQQRERLAAIRERKGAARERVSRARQAIAAAQQAQDKQAEQVAEAELTAAWDESQVCDGLENAVLRQMTGVSREMGHALVNNLDAQRVLQDIAATTAPLRGNVNIGAFMSMDETVELTGSALRAVVDVPDDGGRAGFLGITAPPTPPTSLLALFASQAFDTRTVDLMRRSGVADAAIQVHGAVKHESALTYTPASLRALTVASWVKVNRQDLDDVSALVPDLRDAITYGVLRRVEELLLNGAPASTDGAEVPGILDAPFVPTVTGLTTLDATVGRAKAQMIVNGVEPNFVAAHPLTIEEEESRVGTDGHPVNAITPDGRIRRLPLVATTALAVDQVLIGDSRIGARLGVRQAITLHASDSDQDDFVRNRLTILIEGRWTPLVLVPSAFGFYTIPAAA